MQGGGQTVSPLSHAGPQWAEASLHPNGGSMADLMKERDKPTARPAYLSPSAFALVLGFGLTAYGGGNMVAFEALRHRLWAEPVGQPINHALERLAAWTNTSGIATQARSLALEIVVAETPHDNAAMERALSEFAASSPTSTATWLSLAEVRKARGAPMESVLEAFRMSALTGSHEGFFMTRRAVFGLE